MKALQYCWAHYVESGQWMQTRALHVRLEEPTAERELQHLSGSLLFANYSENASRYQLSGLGIYLSDPEDGLLDVAGQILAGLLELFLKKPERDEIPVKEMVERIPLKPEDERRILILCQNSYGLLGSVTGSLSDYRWSLRLPDRIEWLRYERNISDYLEGQLLAHFDAAEPMNERDRMQQYFRSERNALSTLLGTDNTSTEVVGNTLLFGFVRHTALRELLESDWRDAQRAYTAKAWKACVILCAGIIEGALGEVLVIRGEDWQPGGADAKSSDWNLDAMINQAHKDGHIRSSSFHLYQAVRQVRNLVHPRRQLKEGLKIQESDAQYARAAVADIIRELTTPKKGEAE